MANTSPIQSKAPTLCSAPMKLRSGCESEKPTCTSTP